MTTADGGDVDRDVAPAGEGSPVGEAPAGQQTAGRTPPGRRRRTSSPARARTALVGVVGVGVGLLLGGVVGGGHTGPPSAAAGVSASAPQPVPTVTVTRRPPPRVLRPASRAPDPTRLMIPALGIDQGFVELGITGEDALEVPTRPQDIGWWSGGPAPGDPGGAVVAAHVKLGGEPAAFLDLGSMEPGQEVVVGRADGSGVTYRVTSVEEFPKNAFPDSRVYTSGGPSELHLITCGGDVDPGTGHYLDNVVVFAELVDESPAPAEPDPGAQDAAAAEEASDA